MCHFILYRQTLWARQLFACEQNNFYFIAFQEENQATYMPYFMPFIWVQVTLFLVLEAVSEPGITQFMFGELAKHTTRQTKYVLQSKPSFVSNISVIRVFILTFLKRGTI